MTAVRLLAVKVLRALSRTAWIAAGLAAIAAWVIVAFVTLFTFLVGYGSPPGTYTGQTDDRQGAWEFLIILAVLSVIVALCVVWPLIRWRRGRAKARAPECRSGAGGPSWRSPAEPL